MKLKQIIGIPLLIIFIGVLGNRLVENIYETGGVPAIIIIVLVFLIILMLAARQLFDD